MWADVWKWWYERKMSSFHPMVRLCPSIGITIPLCIWIFTIVFGEFLIYQLTYWFFSQNMYFQEKLVQHTYSNLFGNFLCNTQEQRVRCVYGKTFSIWDFLSSSCFKNHLYANMNSSCWQKVSITYSLKGNDPRLSNVSTSKRKWCIIMFFKEYLQL